LPRLAAARTSSQANRTFTLTGPYGTGKSALAKFAASLFAPSEYPGSAAAQLLLREADPQLAAAVLETGDGAPADLLPVPITGSREPLATAILRGVETTLRRAQGAAPCGSRPVVGCAAREDPGGRSPGANEILELLGKLLEAACDSKSPFGGLFLIFDELGKLLEYAAANHAVSDVYLLQAIAEFAARTPQPFLVLGILHLDFTGYADRLSARERADWEKIRGRFEDIAFVEPADDVLRLIALARSQAQTLHGERHLGRAPASGQAELEGICERFGNWTWDRLGWARRSYWACSIAAGRCIP